MPTLSKLRNALAGRQPDLREGGERRAAVAVVVLPSPEGEKLLFIRRASADGDPWSGDLAFPGGRSEPGDATARHTAERETCEEVGIDLLEADCLGRLDDLQGRAVEIVVSAFVYALEEAPALKLSEEVHAVHWVRIDDLMDPSRHAVERFDYRGHALDLPVIRLDDLGADEGPPLWGLTYRFVELLLGLLGRPLPSMPWREDL
ncbi:MAG: CoA pyrophosphatase [Myxococcota bacterium]|nr:CoA pyrophosphatase [Myxococcota bacterium]MDP6244761.1 CoA pyrophosphatase [Myxococcota bacterium]MDP7073530.1 CoA pyrophosphatase [Myxococcota bacterium]MDP7300686.1 CoA pyrophosphatase [Myxococcota bacterium]MDP7431786.1 CoA pyrophosphatase [Myxococcota bacterium]